MRRVFPTCAALAVFAVMATPQSAPDPLDNLTPTQKLLFENEWVKVVDDQIPPGAVEPMHRHKHGIVINLAAYQTDDTILDNGSPDGKVVHQTRTPGMTTWAGAITHSVKNVSDNTSHAIRIDLKRADPPPPPAADPMDSVRTAGATQTIIFENEFVRVIDDVIPVGATEPMHHHPHGVVVYLSPNYVTEQILPDGSTRSNARKQYDASWAEPLTHSVRNISTITSHAIRIELKY